jgi:hypothetical protein
MDKNPSWQSQPSRLLRNHLSYFDAHAAGIKLFGFTLLRHQYYDNRAVIEPVKFL